MWRSRPIFVSSTFVDMLRERDVLRDEVFPELAPKLLERRQFLEPVDLRWGADDQRVIEVCLDEVDRCRPFMILLHGERQGTMAPPSWKTEDDAVASSRQARPGPSSPGRGAPLPRD